MAQGAILGDTPNPNVGHARVELGTAIFGTLGLLSKICCTAESIVRLKLPLTRP